MIRTTRRRRQKGAALVEYGLRVAGVALDIAGITANSGTQRLGDNLGCSPDELTELVVESE